MSSEILNLQTNLGKLALEQIHRNILKFLLGYSFSRNSGDFTPKELQLYGVLFTFGISNLGCLIKYIFKICTALSCKDRNEKI